MKESLILQARKNYHKQLLDDGILTVDGYGIPSNADKDSKLSIRIAKGVADLLQAEVQAKTLGQTSGAKFESITRMFLSETFPYLQNLRPGKWHIEKLGNRNVVKTSSFAQYEHLDYLVSMTRKDANLAASLGNDYMVSPDIVIYRDLEPDEVINETLPVV